jgi:hypothetical protein
MPDTTNRDKLDSLKEKLEGIANSRLQVFPEVSQTIRSLVVAINYSDEPLMESALNSVMGAFRPVAEHIIKQEVAKSETTKESLRKSWRECVDGVVCENFDELRKVIESCIDKRLASMRRVRDELANVLEKFHVSVENASQLVDSIRDLQEWKENIQNDWPSSSRRPAPVDQQAVAEVREAFARGERGMRKEDFLRSRDPSEKKRL